MAFDKRLAWWALTRKEKAALRKQRKLGRFLPPGLPQGVPAWWAQADIGNEGFATADGFSGRHYIEKTQIAAEQHWNDAIAALMNS